MSEPTRRRACSLATCLFVLTMVAFLGSIEASPAAAAFGFESLGFLAQNRDGSPAQAPGSHPYTLTTKVAFNTTEVPGKGEVPDEEVKNLTVTEPPGLVGDPGATPLCPMPEFLENFELHNYCPAATAVGYAVTRLGYFNGIGTLVTPVYNLPPAPGSIAKIGFTAIAAPVTLNLGLDAEGPDPNVVAKLVNAPQVIQVYGSEITLWGNPGDSSHDAMRGGCLKSNYGATAEFISLGNCPTASPEIPFLTLPTRCDGPLLTSFSAESWQRPTVADRVSGAAFDLDGAGDPVALAGCAGAPFSPSIQVGPASSAADSPSGLGARIEFNTEGLTSPTGQAQSEIKTAVVTLPEGVTVNPAQANGLQSCTESQLSNETPTSAPGAGCPQASKIGTVDVETPLLEKDLHGSVYLAAQKQNRYGSLIALYVTIRSPELGIIVRLAGKVVPDPSTGRLTATFEDLPQLPFSNFALNLNDGPRAALVAPPKCGQYTTRQELTPWSAPDSTLVSTSTWTVSSGPAGGGCPTQQFEPKLRAGTVNPAAGAYSPFSLALERNDGTQRIAGLATSLPQGLLARLAGVPYCPDSVLGSVPTEEGTGGSWLAAPGCPAASQVGTVTVNAGAGPAPLQVRTGRAYLAGPYKGAPLSLAVVTPAIAGPFDLGNVVVRTALDVDPETAQVSAVSDSIPTIVHGIPLDVRSLEVNLDRGEFTRNPTSCDRMAFSGTATSATGASAPISDSFQVGSCGQLSFKPLLKLSLKGSTKHAGHPALKAVLTYPKHGSSANIRRAQVNLPHSEFIDQGNLDKTCTKPVLLEGKCPRRSIYGKARAWTPLLEKPLEGPVYLVGGYGYKLPALVAELNGQIRVVLKGKVDSGKNHGIRNTFEAVPDAPVSRFVLELKGGKRYSLLENSENLCTKPQRAIVRFTGQNGSVEQTRPLIANQCGKHRKKRAKNR